MRVMGDELNIMTGNGGWGSALATLAACDETQGVRWTSCHT